MSRIDELIAQLCPDGVEFKELGEVAITLPGLKGKKKSDFSNGNSKFASYKNIFNNPSLDLSSTDSVRVSEEEKQNSVMLGDVLVTGSSESLDEVGMTSVVTTQPTEPIYVNSFCFIVRFKNKSLLEANYAKHLFRSDSIRKQIKYAANGVTRINLSKPRFMKIRIPVPPLEVQKEIVRILDTFTSLEAELEARRKQYEYYRDRLLTFPQGGGYPELGWGIYAIFQEVG